jgi:hypothetical protein
MKLPREVQKPLGAARRHKDGDLCNPRTCGDLEEGGRARIELLGFTEKEQRP